MVIVQAFHVVEMQRQNQSVVLGTTRYVLVLQYVIKHWDYQFPHTFMILTSSRDRRVTWQRLPLAGRQRERTVTKAQTPRETGILEGAARIVLKHSLLGPRQEQTVIEKVQVDGPGHDFPFWTQVVEVQCCQFTTFHKSPRLWDEWEYLQDKN